MPIRHLIITIWLLCIGLTPLFALSFSMAGATSVSSWIQRVTPMVYEELGVSMNYQPIGSQKGVLSLANQANILAISDVSLQAFDDYPIQQYTQIPIVLTGIAIVVNLPDIPVLKLNSHLLSDIITGAISQWNDPRIQTINHTVSLPPLPIQWIGRKEPNGTDYTLSRFLSLTHADWQSKTGVQWVLPTTRPQAQSDDVAKAVSQTPGGIGCTDAHLADSHHLLSAAIQNQQGHYVTPTQETIRLAAMDSQSPDQLLNTQHPAGYPLSNVAWAIIPSQLDQRLGYQESKTLIQLLWWLIQSGQIEAESMGLAPLSPTVLKWSKQALYTIRYDDVILR